MLSPVRTKEEELQRYREFHKKQKEAQLAKAMERVRNETEKRAPPQYDKSRSREWKSRKKQPADEEPEREEEDDSNLSVWLARAKLEVIESKLRNDYGVESKADLFELDDNFIFDLKQGLKPVHVSRLNKVLGIASPKRSDRNRPNRVQPVPMAIVDDGPASVESAAASAVATAAANAAASSVSAARSEVEAAMKRAVAARQDATLAQEKAASAARAQEAVANEAAAAGQLQSLMASPASAEFKAMDMDGDGVITKADQLALWRSINQDVQDPQVQKRMALQWANLDLEGGGAIDFNTFLAAKQLNASRGEGSGGGGGVRARNLRQASDTFGSVQALREGPTIPAAHVSPQTTKQPAVRTSRLGRRQSTSKASSPDANSRRQSGSKALPDAAKARDRRSTSPGRISRSNSNEEFALLGEGGAVSGVEGGEETKLVAIDVKPLPKRKEKTRRAPTDSTVMKCVASFKDVIDDYGFPIEEGMDTEQATSQVINTITPLVTAKEKVHKGIEQCNAVIGNATYMLLSQMLTLALLMVTLQKDNVPYEKYWRPPEWFATALAGLVFVLRFVESVRRMQARAATARAYRAQLRSIETELDLFAVKVYGHVFEDTYDGVAHHFVQDRAGRVKEMEEKLAEYKDAAKKIEYGLLEIRDENQENFRTQMEALSRKYIAITKEWTPLMAASDFNS
jgi:hypothetical protein